MRPPLGPVAGARAARDRARSTRRGHRRLVLGRARAPRSRDLLAEPHASSCPHVEYDDRAPHALGGGADLVVVEGGLNDTDQPASAVRAGFRTLIGELSGRSVLVVGPPPAPLRADGARRVDAVLREECARAGVRYLSMADRIFPYLDDDLHLTSAGHRAFGSIVAAAIDG
ncbi:MAG: SGNH/GDSL hydrolase family protein [Propionibacteriales bacterium]|nr:SGNH/GDSL hydrolase family protein [Propionibacteriales bacterium]